jgi:hypothetical protein
MYLVLYMNYTCRHDAGDQMLGRLYRCLLSILFYMYLIYMNCTRYVQAWCWGSDARIVSYFFGIMLIINRILYHILWLLSILPHTIKYWEQLSVPSTQRNVCLNRHHHHLNDNNNYLLIIIIYTSKVGRSILGGRQELALEDFSHVEKMTFPAGGSTKPGTAFS